MDQEFMNAFKGANLNAEQLYQQYFGQGMGQGYYGQGSFNTYDPFARFQEQIGTRIRERVKQETANLDPASRRDQINRELDIIRGVVPTPKGYTVDSLRAKALMAELKQLST